MILKFVMINHYLVQEMKISYLLDATATNKQQPLTLQ